MAGLGRHSKVVIVDQLLYGKCNVMHIFRKFCFCYFLRINGGGGGDG